MLSLLAEPRPSSSPRRRGNIGSWNMGPLSRRRQRSLRLDSMQAVGGVLAGEEHDVGVGRCSAVMHDVGGNIDHRAGPGLDLLVADLAAEGALQDVDPLLVGMGMRLGAGAGGHLHQPHDHAVALDAGAVGGGIVGTTEDVIDLGEVEYVLALTRAGGAGGA